MADTINRDLSVLMTERVKHAIDVFDTACSRASAAYSCCHVNMDLKEEKYAAAVFSEAAHVFTICRSFAIRYANFERLLQTEEEKQGFLKELSEVGVYVSDHSGVRDESREHNRRNAQDRELTCLEALKVAQRLLHETSSELDAVNVERRSVLKHIIAQATMAEQKRCDVVAAMESAIILAYPEETAISDEDGTLSTQEPPALSEPGSPSRWVSRLTRSVQFLRREGKRKSTSGEAALPPNPPSVTHASPSVVTTPRTFFEIATIEPELTVLWSRTKMSEDEVPADSTDGNTFGPSNPRIEIIEPLGFRDRNWLYPRLGVGKNGSALARRPISKSSQS